MPGCTLRPSEGQSQVAPAARQCSVTSKAAEASAKDDIDRDVFSR